MNCSVIYRLTSNDQTNAPGTIAWAMKNYATERKCVVSAITGCWRGLSKPAAHKLLSREVPFRVEGDDIVVFEA